jgi:hypothetical protein
MSQNQYEDLTIVSLIERSLGDRSRFTKFSGSVLLISDVALNLANKGIVPYMEHRRAVDAIRPGEDSLVQAGLPPQEKPPRLFRTMAGSKSPTSCSKPSNGFSLDVDMPDHLIRAFLPILHQENERQPTVLDDDSDVTMGSVVAGLAEYGLHSDYIVQDRFTRRMFRTIGLDCGFSERTLFYDPETPRVQQQAEPAPVINLANFHRK